MGLDRLAAWSVADRRTREVGGGKQNKVGWIPLWGRMGLIANLKRKDGDSGAARWEAQR